MSSEKYNDKVSIAIFLPSLNGGGAERVIVTLANAFSSQGYRTDLVLAMAKGPFLQQVSNAVRIVDLAKDRVSKSLYPLIRYLRRERPVAMLSAMTHANLIAILARMLGGMATRLVISEHTTISIEASRSNGIISRIMYSLVPILYPHADGIVAVSKSAAEDLARFARLPMTSVACIYNPFDLHYINKLAMEPLTHPWFKPGEPPVILAIGRLSEEKDYTTLIHAFAQLRKKCLVRLLILGEGELRRTLENMVAEVGLTTDDIEMPGFVTNPFAYLTHCSAFVLSSRWEGLSNVLIEALACGAPVVSTDCPSGPREILEDGRWGILVPVGDSAALAKAIEAVLNISRDQLPNVRSRASDFELNRAVEAYLKALGLVSQYEQG